MTTKRIPARYTERQYAAESQACHAEHEARIARCAERIAAGLMLFEDAPLGSDRPERSDRAGESRSSRCRTARSTGGSPRGIVRARYPGARVRYTRGLAFPFLIVRAEGFGWGRLSARCATAAEAWADAAARLQQEAA